MAQGQDGDLDAKGFLAPTEPPLLVYRNKAYVRWQCLNQPDPKDSKGTVPVLGKRVYKNSQFRMVLPVIEENPSPFWVLLS